MATGTLSFQADAGTPPDGSSGNACPAFTRRQGTESNPKKHFVTADFDASTDEHLYFSFRVPANYASGPVAKLLWMANATSGNVVWVARVSATTPSDADTPVEHASAAANSVTTGVNATEARRLVESSITLTNADSIAAGDLCVLMIHRDADNGSDTCSVDAELINVAFEYVTT